MNKNKQRFEKHSRDYKDVKEYPVKKECELLEFLFYTFPDSSRNSVKSMLSNHRVTVDGAPITQFNFKLFPGDKVLISKTPIKAKSRSNLPIIYEDDDILAINKPSGLLSVASDKEKGSTAYRILTDYVQQKNKHNRVFIVHRLDEDTSGVFIVAKNPKMQKALTDNWNELVSKRGYYAIVEGKLKKKEDTLKNYLAQNSLNLMYITNNQKAGKLAITHFKVMKESDKYSLLDVNIDTGKKNQIRVQLGHIGHFVIGDDKYGEPSNPLKRLGLHSYCLELKNPLSGKKMTFKAPMPKEFETLFK